MLLVFPTCVGVGTESDEVCFVRDLDRDRFNSAVAKKLRAGWQVHEMSSNFRKTLFGGVTAYMAELRRGFGGGKRQKAR